MDGTNADTNANGCVQDAREGDVKSVDGAGQEAVAEMLRGERVVCYRPCFARAFGGTSCALLLSQFCYWAGTPTVRGRGGDGWFWKPQREITEETGLTRRETETARRRLRDLGVLREDLRGLPATLHFRVDAEALCRRLGAFLPPSAPALPPSAPAVLTPAVLTPAAPILLARGSQASLTLSAKAARTDAPGLLGVKRVSTTESPSEKTQKKTLGQTPPPSRDSLPSVLGRREPEKKEAGKRPEKEAKRTGPPDPSLAAHQVGINQSGAARFKAALEAARRKRPEG